MKPIIEIQHISKKFRLNHEKLPYLNLRDSITSFFKKSTNEQKDFWALNDISFNVNAGESIGIIGKNGAGKSTLLKILSKITPPTSGRIFSRGRTASLLEVGTGFHPELNGRENIFLNGAILGMKKKEIRKKFDEMVDFSGVEYFLDTPLKHYSSGMQLRLAFAVAAFLEPEILVIDEVLAVGDAEFQKKCIGKMESISKNEGRTILFVSHNLAAVRRLCTKSVLLESGKLLRMAETDSIVTDYLQAHHLSKGLRVWNREERPGNHSIKLNRVELKNRKNEMTGIFNISEEIIIEIDFDIVKSSSHVRFSMVLMNAEGECLFGSLSNADTVFHGNSHPAGNYTSTNKIYPHLLNNGKFYITILGYGEHWGDYFKAENVVAFETIDDGVLKKDYMNEFGGFFRPRLEWSTKNNNS